MIDRCPTCDREECPSWTNRRGFRCPVACDVYMCVHVAPLAQNAYDNCAAHAVDWRAEALALRAEVAALKARPLTVGAALALPAVQSGACVVEYASVISGSWWQLRNAPRNARVRSALHEWGLWSAVPMYIEDMALPCRLVLLANADLPPATRGDTMSDMTDLRARAEELLSENATAERPDPRSWMDGADHIIRDILAALPPDPAPTDPTMAVARAIFAARCPGIPWMDEDAPVYLKAAADAIDSLDPAPTGERMPCPEWEEEGSEWVMCAGAFLLVVWVRECKDDAGNITHGWRVNDGDDDVAFCALTVPLTLEAAQLAAEDAAAELLTAGLRALGRGGE